MNDEVNEFKRFQSRNVWWSQMATMVGQLMCFPTRTVAAPAPCSESEQAHLICMIGIFPLEDCGGRKWAIVPDHRKQIGWKHVWLDANHRVLSFAFQCCQETRSALTSGHGTTPSC